MKLVQIFLPLSASDGVRFNRQMFERVEQFLLHHFNGFTAYTRSPANGLWKDSQSRIEADDIVIYEVMTDSLDRPWWRDNPHQIADD